MPSLTTWNRLEPRPRAPSIARSLAAKVRDPLWMLARQWQFEEFRGADSGSPAFVRLEARVSNFTGWRVEGENQVRPVSRSDPLEDLVLSEAFTPNLLLRVELGQVFETFVGDKLSANPAVAEAMTAAIRRAYPLPPVPGEPAPAPLFTARIRNPAVLDTMGTVTADLADLFAKGGIPLSRRSVVSPVTPGSEWRLADPDYERRYWLSWVDPILSVDLEPLRDLAGDREAAKFHQVCAGRSIDGLAIYRAAGGNLPVLPTSVAGVHAAAINAAGNELRQWVLEVYGDLGVSDPPAWNPPRLEYGIEAVADHPEEGTAILRADPGRDGDFDWYAFDLRSTQGRGMNGQAIRFSVIPGHVRFRGMPNARWWDFEAATTPFGEIQPDKRDVAKLVMMDFMLVHGNDWFVIPLDQPLGTLGRVVTLTVRDVFGVDTLIERADAGAAAPGERWTMFSTTVEGKPEQVANVFVLPPTAAAAVQVGPTLEEVRFLRDDMANMVWAIEHATEDGVGAPWLGHERDLARREAPPAPPVAATGVPLRYLLQTTVPEHWIPFLPVAVDPSRGDIQLERSFMPRTSSGSPQDVWPMGRILRPTNLAPKAYYVFEEEVPREGVRVSRVVVRSRWTDGSTHLWIARQKTVGSGEGSSGLRFDLAIPTDLPSGSAPP